MWQQTITRHIRACDNLTCTRSIYDVEEAAAADVESRLRIGRDLVPSGRRPQFEPKGRIAEPCMRLYSAIGQGAGRFTNALDLYVDG